MAQELVIGIDVGGQTTKCGVVDARGTVLAQTVIRSDTYTEVEPYIAELAEALKRIIAEAKAEGLIRGIGVGAPNGNYYTFSSISIFSAEGTLGSPGIVIISPA